MKFFVKKNIEIHFQKHLGTKIKMMAGRPQPDFTQKYMPAFTNS